MGQTVYWDVRFGYRSGNRTRCRPGLWIEESVCDQAPHVVRVDSDDLHSNDKSKVSKNYLSIRGAFNGSGIALASQSFESGGFGSIVMYFQHHTGQIRSAQLDNDGDWKGGDATEVVATDAKNGTPIAAVAYARNETARVLNTTLSYSH